MEHGNGGGIMTVARSDLAEPEPLFARLDARAEEREWWRSAIREELDGIRAQTGDPYDSMRGDLGLWAQDEALDSLLRQDAERPAAEAEAPPK